MCVGGGVDKGEGAGIADYVAFVLRELKRKFVQCRDWIELDFLLTMSMRYIEIILRSNIKTIVHLIQYISLIPLTNLALD